ncbi:MAG TPA: cyclic nucleotide-binding domain-containing protein [Gemmatimonadaceae bacterium]
MFAKDVKIEKLRRVPLFSECSKRQLAQIAAIADELDFPAERTLIKEGEAGHECFVIVDGSIELRRRGRRIPLTGDANIFGEMALLTGAPRNATLTTLSPVRALVITDRAFNRLLNDQPGIQRKILASLATRLAAVD